MSLCLFCTVACGVWETVTGQHFRLYLPWDPLAPKDSISGGASVTALLVFFSYGIVMNTVVPISLYVRCVFFTLYVPYSDILKARTVKKPAINLRFLLRITI